MYFDNSLHIALNFRFVSIDETDVSGDIFYRGHPVVFNELQNKQVSFLNFTVSPCVLYHKVLFVPIYALVL